MCRTRRPRAPPAARPRAGASVAAGSSPPRVLAVSSCRPIANASTNSACIVSLNAPWIRYDDAMYARPTSRAARDRPARLEPPEQLQGGQRRGDGDGEGQPGEAGDQARAQLGDRDHQRVRAKRVALDDQALLAPARKPVGREQVLRHVRVERGAEDAETPLDRERQRGEQRLPEQDRGADPEPGRPGLAKRQPRARARHRATATAINAAAGSSVRLSAPQASAVISRQPDRRRRASSTRAGRTRRTAPCPAAAAASRISASDA